MLQAEGAQAKPKSGSANALTSNCSFNGMLRDHVTWLHAKRVKMNSILQSTRARGYRWHICTYHVYKRVKPAVAKRLAKLSTLTDKMRKQLVTVRREKGSVQREYEHIKVKRHPACISYTVDHDVSFAGRYWLVKPRTVTPVMCFTKEITQDGYSHYHGFIGLPVDDMGQTQVIKDLKNYVTWTADSDVITLDYIKYIFKYSNMTRFHDYFDM